MNNARYEQRFEDIGHITTIRIIFVNKCATNLVS